MDQAANLQRSADRHQPLSPRMPGVDSADLGGQLGEDFTASSIAVRQQMPDARRTIEDAVRRPNAHPTGTDDAVEVAADRHAVAMWLSAFMVLLAAALMYQGAASRAHFDQLFAAGMVCIAIAAVTALVARRFRARPQPLTHEADRTDSPAR